MPKNVRRAGPAYLSVGDVLWLGVTVGRAKAVYNLCIQERLGKYPLSLVSSSLNKVSEGFPFYPKHLSCYVPRIQR